VNAFKPDARRASDYDLERFDHILIESDVEGCEHLWLRVVAQVPGVVSLTLSGNVSVHALVKTGATNFKEFCEFRDYVEREYVPLGACPGSLTASRLSRLPNVVNGKTGNVQRLLYFNPGVQFGETIYKKENALTATNS
jgi:hypothetical protein